MKSSKEIARMHNRESASLKDWRLNKEGKRMREIALRAIDMDCLVGTVAEINERFGNIIKADRVADHEPDERFVWAITNRDRGNGRMILSIACIGKEED